MSIDTTAANRAARRAHRHGLHRHRTLARQSIIAVVAAAAVAAGIALAPPALAAPGQAGITDGGGQAGITGGGGQSGVTTEPTPPPATEAPAPTEPIYWIDPPAQYQNIDYQPLPNWDYDTNTYTPPTYTDRLHPAPSPRPRRRRRPDHRPPVTPSASEPSTSHNRTGSPTST